jgi:hypothetical protein
MKCNKKTMKTWCHQGRSVRSTRGSTKSVRSTTSVEKCHKTRKMKWEKVRPLDNVT